MSPRTLVIAEAGVNHIGDIALAKSLIDAASDAGADIVKFQTFSADRLVSISAEKAEYQVAATDPTETQHAMLKRLELSESMHVELIKHCKLRGIQFLSTAFDIESIDLLLALGQQLFKIPSGEITNLPYLRHIGRIGKPVIISTGMSNIDEIGAALSALEAAGTQRSLITVLHCTTNYPTAMPDVNLRAMLTIKDAFGVSVGYSDHTPGIEVPIAAVAMGATVIEKHFTTDRNLPGPDQKASLEPDELTEMVRAIRNIELALGDGEKKATVSESKNMPVARKSIVASRAIKIGDELTETNLTTKRPGFGISPMEWDLIIGTLATRNFAVGEVIDR